MTTAPPVNIYRYVDTATGGVANRNTIRDLRTWPSGPLGLEVYKTWMQFTEDLVRHTKEMAAQNNGKPTVKGYDGPALALFLPFDIDAPPTDRAVALDRARALLRHLDSMYELDLGAVRCYFSGNKGFSIEIPTTVFGEISPGQCRVLSCWPGSRFTFPDVAPPDHTNSETSLEAGGRAAKTAQHPGTSA